MFLRSGISQEEIDDAVRFLVERHGAGAGAEAARLADVGRRLGSWRNAKVFRLAASALSGQGAAAARQRRPWLEALREFGRPRIEDPPEGV